MYAYHIQRSKGAKMKVKTLRMPEWLEKALEQSAKKDDRSFSNEVLRRLKESVAKDGIVCPE
ncbi:TPA: Arc family DNA-binding protein [Escherichia coli]